MSSLPGVRIELNNGCLVCVPLRLLPELAGASRKDLLRAQILGAGQAIECRAIRRGTHGGDTSFHVRRATSVQPLSVGLALAVSVAVVPGPDANRWPYVPRRRLRASTVARGAGAAE